jgi:hypothetical protein
MAYGARLAGGAAVAAAVLDILRISLSACLNEHDMTSI